jgi:hypothetical protein
MTTSREVQLVNTFVVAAKRERYANFVSSPKLRPKFLRELYHFHDFDADCVVELKGASDSAAGVITELRRLGAVDDCYVISNNDDLDGATKPLSEIIERVFAFVVGTVVCCVPGRLAYFEGEPPKNRFILHRRAAY